MLANWVKETTTTTGTGTLTLSAITNYPRVSTVALVDGEPFSYVILNDSDGTPIEAGIGRYVATNTFARDIITATWNGTTWDNTTATPVSLASGTKRLVLTPHANTMIPALPSIDGVSSGIAKTYWSAHLATTYGNPNSISADTAYYTPFLLTGNLLAAKTAVHISSAAGSGKARIAMFTIKNGYPDAKILESNDITITSTGFITTSVATSRRLSPGWYAIGIVTSVGFSMYKAEAGNERWQYFGPSPFGCDSTNGFRPIGFRYHSVTGGWSSFPAVNASSTGVGLNSDYPPLLGLTP